MLFGRKRSAAFEAWRGSDGIDGIGRRPLSRVRTSPASAAPAHPPCGLLDAYAAALAEVADAAGRLEAGDLRIGIMAVDLRTIAGDAIAAVAPLATAAGIGVFSDPFAPTASCPADPALLALVLRHLLLAMLTRERRPTGQLRLQYGLDGSGARICILSRTPTTPPKDVELDDAHALLQAMGADLSIGPAGAGYLPLSVRLKVDVAAQALAKTVAEAA